MIRMTRPFASTYGTQAAGLAFVGGPGVLSGLSITNYSASAAYALIVPGTYGAAPASAAIPTAIPGAPGPSNMLGHMIYVPATTQVILGQDMFGQGWQFQNMGIAVGMSSSSSTFASAGNNFDITFIGDYFRNS
jgi:hypothetical protein